MLYSWALIISYKLCVIIHAKIGREWAGSDWLSMVLRLRQHNIGYTADGFYRSDDTTNSVKALKEVVSHPDRPQSNQAHLTMLQYYNMHPLHKKII